MDIVNRTIPKRRRRPLSSCENCRQRKVKCDQNSPCNQCIRSKRSSCIYAPHASRPKTLAGLHSPKLSDQPAAARVLHQSKYIEPAKHSLNTPGSGFGQVTHNTQQNHDKTVIPPSPAPTTTSNFLSNQDLSERVRQLEERISTLSKPGPSFERQPIAKPGAFKGAFSKTRMVGRSNFMYVVHHEQDGISDLQRNLQTNHKGIMLAFEKCKQLGKKLKNRHQWNQPISSDLKSYLPSKDVCDVLVEAYFRTVETVFRILHVPSFREEYDKFWLNPDSSNTFFIIKLLLVAAIGAAFPDDSNTLFETRNMAKQWISVAHSWLTFPAAEKHRVSFAGVQVHCLLLIAREVVGVGSDLTWIAVGALLRVAMLIGLHRDPSCMQNIPFLHAELRRRLWVTVMELAQFSSMSVGGAPMIDLDEYDCRPPMNLDDNELYGSDITAFTAEPEARWTQTSMQLLLLRTLRTRIRIAQALNDSKTELSHAETIALGSELSVAHRQVSALIDSRVTTSSASSVFQRKLLTLINLGHLNALHLPYAIQAHQNPAYYFSRKVCLDAALSLLSPSLPPSFENTNTQLTQSAHDVRCLEIGGGTNFRNVHASLVLWSEQCAQPEDTPSYGTNFHVEMRTRMRDAVDRFRLLSLDRLKSGETNIKGYVCACLKIAQIEAIEQGRPTEDAMVLALKSSLNVSSNILEEHLGISTTPASDSLGFPNDDNIPGILPSDFSEQLFWPVDDFFEFPDINDFEAWNVI